MSETEVDSCVDTNESKPFTVQHLLHPAAAAATHNRHLQPSHVMPHYHTNNTYESTFSSLLHNSSEELSLLPDNNINVRQESLSELETGHCGATHPAHYYDALHHHQHQLGVNPECAFLYPHYVNRQQQNSLSQHQGYQSTQNNVNQHHTFNRLRQMHLDNELQVQQQQQQHHLQQQQNEQLSRTQSSSRYFHQIQQPHLQQHQEHQHLQLHQQQNHSQHQQHLHQNNSILQSNIRKHQDSAISTTHSAPATDDIPSIDLSSSQFSAAPQSPSTTTNIEKSEKFNILVNDIKENTSSTESSGEKLFSSCSPSRGKRCTSPSITSSPVKVDVSSTVKEDVLPAQETVRRESPAKSNCAELSRVSSVIEDPAISKPHQKSGIDPTEVLTRKITSKCSYNLGHILPKSTTLQTINEECNETTAESINIGFSNSKLVLQSRSPLLSNETDLSEGKKVTDSF